MENVALTAFVSRATRLPSLENLRARAASRPRSMEEYASKIEALDIIRELDDDLLGRFNAAMQR